jgi:hypothetical protein
MAKINLNSILAETKDAVERIEKTVEVAQQPLPDFDAILMEWSWRCEKGYPDFNNKKDMIALKEVLNEMNLSIPDSLIIEATSKKGYDLFLSEIESLGKADQYQQFLVDLPNGGVSSPLVRDLTKTFNSLSAAIIKSYAKEFKSSETITALNNKSYTPYIDLYNINIEKATGKGELMMAFLVQNAIHMGSGFPYDVTVTTGTGASKYEVKDINVGTIRPGKEGKISQYPISREIFDIFKIIYTIQQDSELQDSMLTLGDSVALKQILDVVNKVKTLGSKGDRKGLFIEPGNIATGNLDSLFNSLVELNEFTKQSLIKKDMTTSKLKVRSSSKDATFWIPDEDIDDIINGSGKDKEVTIKVGTQVTDESKDAASLLIDLINHPLVKTPMKMVEKFKEIKNAFFGDKAGLIYFNDKKVNIVTNLDKFATVSISQDNYRFDLAKTDSKYNFIKLQAKQ